MHGINKFNVITKVKCVSAVSDVMVIASHSIYCTYGDFFVLLFLTTASFDTRGLFAMIFFGVTSGVTLLAGWGRLPAVVLAAAAGRADGARGCAAVGDVPLRTGTGIPRWVFFAGD